MKTGHTFKQEGRFLVPAPQSVVPYSTHISPVCLPCMNSNCVSSILRSKGILNGTESKQQYCQKEGKQLK